VFYVVDVSGCEPICLQLVGTPILVNGATFPDDLDTTALALMVVPPEELSTVHVILDNMLSFVHQDGRFQVRLASLPPMEPAKPKGI
jgi:hypothetical protein